MSSIYNDIKKHNMKFYDAVNNTVVNMDIVRSFSEPNKHSYSELLFVKKIVSSDEYKYNERYNDKFYILLHPDNTCGKLKDFITYLQNNKYKLGLLQIHSNGTEAVITSIEENDFIHFTHISPSTPKYGFKCFILKSNPVHYFVEKYGNVDDNDDFS